MSGLFQSILEWIYRWVGNYGWSVVVFTLLIRMIMLPLDIKSKKSMRAMNKIQPKVALLQKKYANDKDKLNQKLNELYRKEHVSPMASCLPMLITLPILWFMFAAMRNMANEHTIQMILNIAETGEVPAMQSWLWIKN
ncbi:MAG: YidC/Oxa1 family membrane protein insertase, partial [Aristaeellaceae bacterium]